MNCAACGKHIEPGPIPYCNDCLFDMGLEAEGREYANCNPRLRANYNYNKKYWKEL